MELTFIKLLTDLAIQNKENTISSIEDALYQSYRVLLGRLPDLIGYEILSSLNYPINSTNIIDSILLSEEFLSGWIKSLNRLRSGLDVSLTWHIHIPRTGGTKFAKDWLHAGGFVLPAPLRADPRANSALSIVEQLTQFYDALASGQSVLVSGHVTLAEISHGVAPSDTVLVTIRHPIDRALSLYRYGKALAAGGNTIIGYPDDQQMKHFSDWWKETLSNHGLSERSTIKDFVSSSICEDGELEGYLATPGISSNNISSYLKESGINVLDQLDMIGGTYVNGTTNLPSDQYDYDLMAERFTSDIKLYHQIRQAFSVSNES